MPGGCKGVQGPPYLGRSPCCGRRSGPCPQSRGPCPAVGHHGTDHRSDPDTLVGGEGGSRVTVLPPTDPGSFPPTPQPPFWVEWSGVGGRLTIPEAVIAPARRVVVEAVGGGGPGPPVALKTLRVAEAIAVPAEAAIVPICRGQGRGTSGPAQGDTLGQELSRSSDPEPVGCSEELDPTPHLYPELDQRRPPVSCGSRETGDSSETSLWAPFQGHKEVSPMIQCGHSPP